MRFGYIWILLKDHLLSPGRRDGKGSEKFNLNLPVPPPGSVVFWQPPPPFYWQSNFYGHPPLHSVSDDLSRHSLPPWKPRDTPNPPTPTPLRRWWIVSGPFARGGELRVQGEGVEGIEEKFIFCHVSNFRYFQLKIKMPFVYVTLYVCPII